MQFSPNVEKILAEVWENFFHFLRVFIYFFTFFLTYDLIDRKNFSQKVNSGHGKCNVDKTAEKNAKRPKIVLLKNHKNLVETFWTKIIIALKFPLDS